MWSQTKQRLEKEFLCKKLQGRITYNFASYRTDETKENNRLTLCLDGSIILQANTADYFIHGYYKYEVHLRVITRQVLQSYPEVTDSEEVINQIANRYMAYPAGKAGVFKVDYALDSIYQYFNMDIRDILSCENYFIQMLGVLDRRVGKRTLQQLAKKYSNRFYDIPDWLRVFYQLRFDVEGIPYND